VGGGHRALQGAAGRASLRRVRVLRNDRGGGGRVDMRAGTLAACLFIADACQIDGGTGADDTGDADFQQETSAEIHHSGVDNTTADGAGLGDLRGVRGI